MVSGALVLRSEERRSPEDRGRRMAVEPLARGLPRRQIGRLRAGGRPEARRIRRPARHLESRRGVDAAPAQPRDLGALRCLRSHGTARRHRRQRRDGAGRADRRRRAASPSRSRGWGRRGGGLSRRPLDRLRGTGSHGSPLADAGPLEATAPDPARRSAAFDQERTRKAASASSPKDSRSARRLLRSSSTSRVEQFPFRTHTTFGGYPKRRLR